MANKKEEALDPVILEAREQMDNYIEEIQGIDEQVKELEALRDVKISKIQAMFKDKENVLLAKRNFLVRGLRGLFDAVPVQETKTQRKCVLLSGDVIVKKATKKIECDKAKLLEWAKANDRKDLIEKKETAQFKWAEFKRILAVQDGLEADVILDTTTGEIIHIDGLSIVYEDEKLEIK